jgi:hypothetical protein
MLLKLFNVKISKTVCVGIANTVYMEYLLYFNKEIFFFLGQDNKPRTWKK